MQACRNVRHVFPRVIDAPLRCGNSHAAALAGALRALSRQSGYRLIELTEAACPMLDGVSSYLSNNPDLRRRCAQFHRAALDYIDHDSSIQVVIVAGFWSEPFHALRKGAGPVICRWLPCASINQTESWRFLRSGLGQLVTRLQHDGKVVYLVQNNASFSFDPRQIMLGNLLWLRNQLANVLGQRTFRSGAGLLPIGCSDAMKARDVISAVAAAHPGIDVIDLRNTLCSPVGCKFALGTRRSISTKSLVPAGVKIGLIGLNLP